jgi:hypothetical protein
MQSFTDSIGLGILVSCRSVRDVVLIQDGLEFMSDELGALLIAHASHCEVHVGQATNSLNC